MQIPNHQIHIEIKEKQFVSSKPELSFTNFLDDRGNALANFDSPSSNLYENDRNISFDHRYKVKVNHNEFYRITSRTGIQPGCQRFWKRFMYAKRVYILDKFFSAENFFRLLYEKEKITSLCGSAAPIIKIIARDIKILRELDEDCAISFAQESNLDSLKYIHDRFAWIDGEIWHFGASVGGMHADYHAVSGGWEDIGGNFEKFCESFFN